MVWVAVLRQKVPNSHCHVSVSGLHIFIHLFILLILFIYSNYSPYCLFICYYLHSRSKQSIVLLFYLFLARKQGPIPHYGPHTWRLF